MDFDVDVRRFSADFYTAYPHQLYPEILQKGDRPYTCLLIDLHEDYFICLPFRSEMKHNQGFVFSGTKRSSHAHSGLDYKKMVLIQDLSYIDNQPAVVDSDEYNMVMTNLQTIVGEAVSYVHQYIQHIDGTKVLHQRDYDRKYRFSTLPYFHVILGLDVKK